MKTAPGLEKIAPLWHDKIKKARSIQDIHKITTVSGRIQDIGSYPDCVCVEACEDCAMLANYFMGAADEEAFLRVQKWFVRHFQAKHARCHPADGMGMVDILCSSGKK